MNPMWLLDVNIPIALTEELQHYGIKSKIAQEMGWRKLENGDLILKAYNAGFTCLLTRDKNIESSAVHVFKKIPDFSVVVIQLTQMKESLYLKAFKDAWNENPIMTIPGKVIFWP